MEALKHTFQTHCTTVNITKLGGCIMLSGFAIGLLTEDVELNLANLSAISYWLSNAGGIILLALACHMALPVIGHAIRLFVRYLFSNRQHIEKMMLIESGIDTQGDVLIRTDSPRESPAVIADKLAAQIGDDPTIWGAFFQFRNPVALLFDGTGQPKEFERVTGPEGYEYQLSAHDRKTESWSEYEADLKNFFRPWPEWVKEQKWNSRPKTVQSFIEAARTAYTILALCLVPFVVSGQNITAQVRTYLGETRFSTDKPNGQIIFRFEKGDIPREGRGRTYEQMLPDNPYFKDSNTTGKLKEVLVGGQRVEPVRVAPAKQVENPTYVSQTASRAEQARMVRPSSLEGVPVATGFERMDSVEMAERLEASKVQFEDMKHEAGKVFQPVWRFLMYIFTSLLFLLIPAFFVLRYVSRTAAQEMMMTMWGRTVTGRWMKSAHENSAAGLMLICWAVTIVFLLDSYVWLLYHGYSQGIIIAIGVPAVWLAEVVTNHIVPNIPVTGTDIIRK